jgi:hypothetical protein
VFSLFQRPSGTAHPTYLHIAQSIYDTLWNKPLEHFRSESTASLAGTTSYYRQELINEIHLSCLKFRENILLIREEYETAYKVIQSWPDHEGGVVVTGQPGIGE